MKIGLQQDMKGRVLDLISTAAEKYTQNRLAKELIKTGWGDRKTVKSVIRELLDNGELSYTYNYGCSFLEKSIHKVNRISERVSLAPVDVHVEEAKEKICVKLGYGASFGTGRHPTTRLSIKAIDFLLSQKSFCDSASKGMALDIGTGSGVLAITAVKLGMCSAIGLDIEAISRKEAVENVEHNDLSAKIRITGEGLDEITGDFSLILANLRLPTLIQIAPIIRSLSTPLGGVVLSGVKTEELSVLEDNYIRNGFLCLWQLVEKGWACQVFINMGLNC
ncbi:MAG: hypothetical protein C4522_19045 [Desulfobacteraceae bacterium]|nr:MAG: hypothetical protein C4522_19045 [Desulfobacteraceae bacterium]